MVQDERDHMLRHILTIQGATQNDCVIGRIEVSQCPAGGTGTPGKLLNFEFIVEECLVQLVEESLQVKMFTSGAREALSAAEPPDSVGVLDDGSPVNVTAVQPFYLPWCLELEQLVQEKAGDCGKNRKGSLLEDVTDTNLQRFFLFLDGVAEPGVRIKAN